MAALFGFTACQQDAVESTEEEQTEISAMMEAFDRALNTARETKGDGNPAFWKLADADTTIYLYGTFHLLPPSTQWQTPEFLNALNSSDTVYFEIDLEDENLEAIQQIIIQDAMFKGGETLNDVMTESQRKKFAKLAKADNLSVENLQYLKPWFLSMQLQVNSITQAGYDAEKGVEMVIGDLVEASDVKFGSLETIEDQITAMKAGTMEEQIEVLLFSMEFEDQMIDGTNVLMEEWADGDIAGLTALIDDPELSGSQEMHDAMLLNRNRKWIPEIEAILDEPGTKFIVVGAAHLIGKDSVLKMLENKGYEIEVVQ